MDKSKIVDHNIWSDTLIRRIKVLIDIPSFPNASIADIMEKTDSEFDDWIEKIEIDAYDIEPECDYDCHPDDCSCDDGGDLSYLKEYDDGTGWVYMSDGLWYNTVTGTVQER